MPSSSYLNIFPLSSFSSHIYAFIVCFTPFPHELMAVETCHLHLYRKYFINIFCYLLLFIFAIIDMIYIEYYYWEIYAWHTYMPPVTYLISKQKKSHWYTLTTCRLLLYVVIGRHAAVHWRFTLDRAIRKFTLSLLSSLLLSLFSHDTTTEDMNQPAIVIITCFPVVTLVYAFLHILYLIRYFHIYTLHIIMF